MEKVSAVIIVYNEEKNLRECLETVQGADETNALDIRQKVGLNQVRQAAAHEAMVPPNQAIVCDATPTPSVSKDSTLMVAPV